MSPKSLDPLSRRSNDSAEAESAPIVPRGVDATKVLEKAQASVEARKEAQAKSKRRLIFASLLVGLVVFLVGAGYLGYRNYQQSGLTNDDYAIIEGRRITKAEFEELKSAYIRYDKQKKQDDEKISERRAADELLTRVGLEVEAEKNGITITQADIDDYLAPAYKQYGSKELLLAYNRNLYGWSEEPLFHKARLDLLKQKLKTKMIADMDLFGIYIRWDNNIEKSEEFQKEYGRKAVERLEREFLPRLQSGESADQLKLSTEVNESLPQEINNQRLNATDQPIVRYLVVKSAVNDPENDPFQHGQKADDAKSAWTELEKLQKVGDTTPVFKSDSGMYMALRIERKSEGKFISYDSYLKDAIKRGRVDASYRELPEPKSQKNILPIPTSSPDVSWLGNFLPKAKASGSRDCWAQDPLRYAMRPVDGSAGYAQINSPFTVSVVRSGPDSCIPYNGFGFYMNSQGRQAWISTTVTFGTEIPLNCYGVVWDFAWSAPAGYQNFTPADYQGAQRILAGFTPSGGTLNLVWSPSESSGFWRDGDIYYGIANGAGLYGVAPVFFPDAPPPPPPPTFNVVGGKYDRSSTGNPGGQYADARVRDDNVGDSSTAQPYNLGARTQRNDHTIVAWDTADWVATGWRLQNNGTSGIGNFYGFPAGQVPVNTTQILDFFYEPRPSTIQAGYLVRDPVSGAISNPCTQGGYQNVPCNNGSITLARNTGFNLPGGLVNSYFGGPATQNVSGGLTSFGSLYTGQYRATAASVPAGWRVSGWVACNEGANASNCFPTSGAVTAGNTFPLNISANRTRPIFFVLEPDTIRVRGIKKGPGTFTSTQNSDTTAISQGTVSFEGNQRSAEGWINPWTDNARFNSPGGNVIRATAPTGWLIRGYAFCVGAANQPDCTNDAVQGNSGTGNIILTGNDQQSVDLPINYSSAVASFGGVNINAGQELFVVIYYKPAPVTIQVRGKIDMQGGNTQANTDLNPCNYNDYKRNICTEVEVRPIRMNTVGLANTATPGQDLGDPVGGVGNCTSKDYVPTKPGYNYGGAANTGFYCTTEGGNNRITQAQFLSGQGPLRYGTTLDARTGQISQNGNANENNLAIVRNVYPGKYSFRHKDTPEYDNEAAYTIAQSTCAVGQADCSSSVAPNSNVASCLLNHRRSAQFTAVSQFLWWTVSTPIIGINNPSALNDPNGQDYCTVMWAGPPGQDSWANGGTPENWSLNAARPGLCRDIAIGGWAYNPNWNGTTGSYGINVTNNGPCGYRKDNGAAGNNTFSMGVPVGTSFREQTFYYTPRFRVRDEVLTCDAYSATLVYMPDPSRPVTTYFTIGNNQNLMRTETSTGNDIMEFTTQTSGPDAYKVNIAIPKYNNGVLLKDGDVRTFRMFARFSDSTSGSVDSDLVAGYSDQTRDFVNAGGTWRYAPRLVSNPTLIHQCRNNAVCDQASFQNQLNAISVMDADRPQSNEIKVTIQNTGESFWQQGYRDGNNNGAVPGTYHELVVTGGTLVSNNSSDSRAWFIADSDRRIENGREITPVTINPGASSYTFTVRPSPPKDGASKFSLGFQMRQAKPNGYTEVFGTPCQGDFEIKVSYKPWFRVQNGNVTALGLIQNQLETDRGVYKAENDTSGSLPPGSVDNVNKPKTDDAKPALNLHAQFVVAAEDPRRLVNSICSTNFYMLGFAKNPNNYDAGDANAQQKSRDCSFGSVKLNIQQAEDTNGDGQKELKNNQMIAAANRAYTEYGQCNDDGNIPDVNDGPQELSPPAKYYRSWLPGSPADIPSLEWSLPNRPTASGSPFGTNPGNPAERHLYLVNMAASRPCPTIFRLQTSGNAALTGTNRELGGFTYSAGRSTILSDGTVYITGNIEARLPNNVQYRFEKQNSPDMAGLNALPNLGIISARDIVIASNVTKIDASLYAAGRIITCDLYIAEGGFNNDAGKTDKPGSTGSKWIRRGPGPNTSLDSSPLATEDQDPNVDEAPNADNTSARGCSQQLRITGSVTGGEGFSFGRNFVDFAGMVDRWRRNESAFGGQTPQEFGKFCNISDVLGIRRDCNLGGEPRDFDSPNSRRPPAAPNLPYWLEQKAGWPQNYYTGGPAEDIIGNGLASFMPPPGFEDITASTNTAKYYNNTARPRF